MQAARRLYLYVMSGITLAVVASGLVLLLRVVLDGVFPVPDEFGNGNAYNGSREQLSQAIAMLGVGTPVWAVHWWLVQRGLRVGRPERDAERGSDLRAFYVTGVLLVSLVVWVASAINLLVWAGSNGLHIVPEYTNGDPLGSTTAGLTAFVIWLYHGFVRRRDLAAGPVANAAAFVPRLYLYGVALAGLLVAVASLESGFDEVLTGPPPDGEPTYFWYFLLQEVVTGFGWGLVWLGHWIYAQRLVGDAGWRGVDERISRTRAGAFVAVIVIAAGVTLGDLVNALRAILGPFFPEATGLIGGVTAIDVARPLLAAVPWAVIWFAHARAFRREPAAVDPIRALHQERLVSYSLAATPLAMGAGGASGLLGYLVGVVFGGAQIANPGDPSGWAVVQWLPLTVVGLAAWAWFWRPVIARRRRDPLGEAASTIRRTFLYLTIGVALVAAISTSALILYRFVNVVLGASYGGNLGAELSTPLGVLITAGAVLAYHGIALRRDQALVASQVTAVPEAAAASPDGAVASPDGAAATAGTTPASAPARTRRAFVLVGPEGADLDAAIAAARGALPPYIEIVAVDG